MQEQAGSLNEAAREFALLNTLADEGKRGLCFTMRPVVIWRLCRLLASRLNASPASCRAIRPNIREHHPPSQAWAETCVLPFAPNRRARLGEPRDATVQLLRDGLACCRTTEHRWNNVQHALIAFDLACHFVQSRGGNEAPCGSLAEAEGMLREALPLVGEEHDGYKASILVSLADLMHRQGRDGEAHQAQQELRILQRKYNAAEADGAAPSRPNKRRTRRGNRNRGGEQQQISS